MGAGHGADGLYLPGDSPVHRLGPQCKVAAAILFVFAVVATPREAFWAYAAYAVLLAAVAAVAHVPPVVVARRLRVELPFVAFAFLLPFVGTGERTHVLGVSLSVDGLWGGWNILVKATLGIACTVLLVSTTPVPALLHGLERLKVPRVFTAIAGFMVRYLDVVTGELRRMSVARQARGYDPRWLWQARAVASSAGALFVRSFERGERVHLAMLSRGYTGALPVLDEHGATTVEWLTALALPLAGAAVAVTAWAIR